MIRSIFIFCNIFLFCNLTFALPAVCIVEPQDTAFWGGALGSIAHQKTYSKALGYHANTAGSIIGVDHFTTNGGMLGVAFATTNTNFHQATYLPFITRIFGWHAIAYGAIDLRSDAYFLEWLATGVTNKNKGSRYMSSGGSTFSVNSSYRTSAGGIKINLGQTTDNDTWQFTLIETLSYEVLYQSAYQENSSPFALSIYPRKYSQVFTLGGGLRLAMTEDIKWARRSRELRFIGTYDVVNQLQNVTANFLNGVSDLTVISASARWSFQLGATYAFVFFSCLELQLSYDLQLRTQYTDNAGAIQLRYVF